MRGPTNKLYPVGTLNAEAVAEAEAREAQLLADANARGYADGLAGLPPRERPGFTWTTYMQAWLRGKEERARQVRQPIPYTLAPKAEALLAEHVA